MDEADADTMAYAMRSRRDALLQAQAAAMARQHALPLSQRDKDAKAASRPPSAGQL